MAWSFDEINDEVQITDSPVLTFPDGDWTIGGFIKLDDNIGDMYQYILSWGAWEATPSFNWYISEATSPTNPDELVFKLVDDDGTDPSGVGLVTRSIGNHAQRTDWIHVILQRSGTTVTQYIDNGADGTWTDAAFDGINVGSNLWFGTRSVTPTERWLGGDMAEWAKWDRALNSTERAALVAGVSPWLFQDSMKWYCDMKIGGTNGLYVDYGSSRLTVTNNGSTHGNHPPITIYQKPSLILLSDGLSHTGTFTELGVLGLPRPIQTFSPKGGVSADIRRHIIQAYMRINK